MTMPAKCATMETDPEMKKCMFCMGCPEAEAFITLHYGNVANMMAVCKGTKPMKEASCPSEKEMSDAEMMELMNNPKCEPVDFCENTCLEKLTLCMDPEKMMDPMS